MSERRAKQIRRLELRVAELERKSNLGPGFTVSIPETKRGFFDFLKGLCRKGR